MTYRSDNPPCGCGALSRPCAHCAPTTSDRAPAVAPLTILEREALRRRELEAMEDEGEWLERHRWEYA